MANGRTPYDGQEPDGCITAVRLEALRSAYRMGRNVIKIQNRDQCQLNPIGRNVDHEFTERCPTCGEPRCQHCHCHVL